MAASLPLCVAAADPDPCLLLSCPNHFFQVSCCLGPCPVATTRAYPSASLPSDGKQLMRSDAPFLFEAGRRWFSCNGRTSRSPAAQLSPGLTALPTMLRLTRLPREHGPTSPPFPRLACSQCRVSYSNIVPNVVHLLNCTSRSATLPLCPEASSSFLSNLVGFAIYQGREEAKRRHIHEQECLLWIL